jgi:hypothetical protein
MWKRVICANCSRMIFAIFLFLPLLFHGRHSELLDASVEVGLTIKPSIPGNLAIERKRQAYSEGKLDQVEERHPELRIGCQMIYRLSRMFRCAAPPRV